MNHIRFLTSNRAVCESPKTLGYDFVVVTSEAGESCQECSFLLFAHNQRENQYGSLINLPSPKPVKDYGVVYMPAEKEPRHLLSFVAGALFASFIFLCIMIAIGV